MCWRSVVSGEIDRQRALIANLADLDRLCAARCWIEVLIAFANEDESVSD